MVTTVLIYIENGEPSRFISTAADKESRVNACNCFEDLSVLELPFLVGREPRTSMKGLADIAITIEQFEELRDTSFPPLREVILSRKSSRPALLVRARLNMSGNSGLPFLIWDKLT